MAVARRHLTLVQPTTPTQSRDRLQRSWGAARIAFKRRAGATALAEVHQSGCSKVRFPTPEPGAPPEAVLMNTAGGLTDYDSLDTDVRWQAGTCAIVTTQAAERIYRSRGEPARVDNILGVEEGATALWLPQETILFDGGNLYRRMKVELAGDACLLACESTVFGRRAMGESIRAGALHDAWRVRRGGRLIFADGFRLSGDMHSTLTRRTVADGSESIASIVYVAADAAAACERLRPVVADAASTAGCSARGPVLIARLLATSSAQLRQDVIGVLETLLAHLSESGRLPGKPAPMPRVWSC